MYDFYKKFIFLSKTLSFFSNKVVCSKWIFVLYPPFKKFNFVKKNHSVKIFILFKQAHSVKHEFYFQCSFAMNEQV